MATTTKVRRLELFDPQYLVPSTWVLALDLLVRMGLSIAMLWADKEWPNFQKLYLVAHLHTIYWMLCLLFRGSLAQQSNTKTQVYILPYSIFCFFKLSLSATLTVKDWLSWNDGQLGHLGLAFSHYWIAYDFIVICMRILWSKQVLTTLDQTQQQMTATTKSGHAQTPVQVHLSRRTATPSPAQVLF